jgi:hypothetical protein
MKHASPEALEALDLAWDDEAGFLGLLRGGRFDSELANKYLSLLNSINIEEGESLNGDFVRLVWFVPLFMEWQVERAVEHGVERVNLNRWIDRIRERVMELLGVP